MQLQGMEGEKTPGPDGFQMMVFKKCWWFLKKDFMAVIKELQDNAFINWRLSNTFISLIPNKEGDKAISDFQPINFLWGITK